MDNEKDLYIKNKLQEDKLISKKADDIFNKLNKGELFMKKNENLKNNNTTNENSSNINKHFSKWKKLIATAASFVIIFGAANVYATSQGYDNIFFLVRYLVTGDKTITGKDNIMSDRDITISYEPINIGDGLNITVKKLQIKNNEAKLFILTSEKEHKDRNNIPLTFKAYNDKNIELCNQKSVKDNQNSGSVTDELLLNGFRDNDSILKLEVYNTNSEIITTLKIDLNNKTIEIQGEAEALQKISEIELKKFLGYAAGLSQKTQITDDEIKIDLACHMLSDSNLNVEKEIDGIYAYPVEEVDNMLESFIGKKIVNFKNGIHIKLITKNGKKYYTYNNPGDESSGAECINISNISYCNGIYTVNYSFYYRGSEPDEDVNIDNYDVYEQEICLSLNENNKYCKYTVKSMEDPTIIKKANNDNSNTKDNNSTNETNSNTESTNTNTTSNIDNNTPNTNSDTNTNTNTNSNTNSNNNVSNEKIDNYASSMSWSEYWAPGIKLQYPSNWKIEEIGDNQRGNRQGQLSTIISGTAQGIDRDTNEIIETNMEIEIYEPEFTDASNAKDYYNLKTNSSIDNVDLVSGYTMNNSGRWYSHLDYDNGKKIDTYINYYKDLKVGYVIKIKTNQSNKTNWKVINITNWIFGSIKFTSW